MRPLNPPIPTSKTLPSMFKATIPSRGRDQETIFLSLYIAYAQSIDPTYVIFRVKTRTIPSTDKKHLKFVQRPYFEGYINLKL
jgi:hypothetical protein